MLKNEKGYPEASVFAERADRMADDGQRARMDNSATPDSGDRHGATPELHSGCGGRGDCLDTVPLAYVYAPSQQFRLLYSAKDALSHGTLFEELYKPMEVYGREF
ncbi:MAG: spore coat associated protein CotJA [Clostridia bacterium]|nr:spore coat associated protein CotJA [Clostridia bacterium]